jgi:CRP-like cAMP-binding protein
MKAIMDFKKFDFFHAFSDNQLEKLLKVTEKKTFKKGTQIYKEGDRANQIYIVCKGWVKLRKIDPGKGIDISFENRSKGELFGAACFMKPQDYQIGYLFLKEIAKVYFERYKSVKRQLYGMVQDPATITALPG